MTSHAGRGKGWEAMLADQHREYKRQRRGSVEKMHPPFKFLGAPVRGRFSGALEGEAACDYSGAVLGRVPVLFDAKECSGERWPFSDLPVHQGRDLECFHQFGWAFVLLRWHDTFSVLVPWGGFLQDKYNAWRLREGRAGKGEASLSYETALSMARNGFGFDDADWLPVIERLERARVAGLPR